jgi:hypothetical protein
VAVSTEAIAPWIPPPGRHVLVVPAQTVQQAAHWLAPISEFVVALGTDDLARSEPYFPRHARRSPLGRMQHPPLDGPVDLRT